MIQKLLLPVIICILLYGFWISPDFKEISAWVSIFLFGMMFLGQWFKSFTGWTLENILQKCTNKTWKSLLFGFSAATLMQSSSLVSVLTISFLSAELITLIQGLWIIFGSNLGTTTWAWLIAAFGMKVNISAYAMPMLVFWVLFGFQKSKAWKWLGSILAWLGFLFLWIHYMKSWFESFQTSINLIEFAMTWYLWVLVFAGIGILATIVMQSSHATIILVIAALATWQITYENALALVIWANVWTTITAIIWSLTSNLNWKRLATADVMFKSTTGIIFILWMFWIADFVDYLATFIWIAADNYTLKLALFHTLFNLTGIIMIVPFIHKFKNLVTTILPEPIDKNKDKTELQYLHEATLEYPDAAIISLIKETKHLYRDVVEWVLDTFGLSYDEIISTERKKELIPKIQLKEAEYIDDFYNKHIKILYGKIIDFSTKAQSLHEDKYSDDFYKIKLMNREIIDVVKSVKHLHKNLNKYMNSPNTHIQNEYSRILWELLEMIHIIDKINSADKSSEKLLQLGRMEYYMMTNDVLSNGKIDHLIRENLVTMEMATSLMNDSKYKAEICKNLFEISTYICNQKISEDLENIDGDTEKTLNNWFNHTLWMSDKKREKALKKLRTRKNNLKQKLKKIEEVSDKATIQKDIKMIEFVLKKYK